MATPAHCIACFEALDAHLAKRPALSLDEIQSLYEQFVASTSSSPAPNKNPTLSRLANPSPSSSSTSSTTGLSTSTPDTSNTSLSSIVANNIPDKAPLFVTWNVVESDDDEEDEEVSLRGCIGTFSDELLEEGIPEYALISALRDTRFRPIKASELPSLQAAVTLLTDFEKVDDPYDWVVGVHGVRLSFHDKGRRYGSTYLPDVASEQGWTREEALYSLSRKAGWVGSQSKWRDLDLQVTRYQGKKCSVRYAEYKRFKAWVDAK
ncbi:AMMECR1 [Emericellopsis cladophorae]|uniref:AMMECR1 n=1 Tax=Emericellopsis cladophorae TaxID=2686198 RepID=A0A9P9XZM3_9HYPO|nr:AMMECR1 [Emericellopsis cladophorae]KAI6780807.1 AMMECR1 [Emericellopsis cladophorae]